MSAQVKVHTGAVRELLNSPGVMGMLQEQCDPAAARCNALVEWHSPMQAPAFIAKVDNGKFTAVGKVFMNPGLGRDGKAVMYYEAKHKVLLKGCGW